MFSGTQQAYLGLDVGGTNVKYGLVDAHGEMLWGCGAPPAPGRCRSTRSRTSPSRRWTRAIQAGYVVAGVGWRAPGPG